MGIGVLPRDHPRDHGDPFIAAVMRDVFEIVPPVLRSRHALGSTTWEVVWNVCSPTRKSA